MDDFKRNEVIVVLLKEMFLSIYKYFLGSVRVFEFIECLY